jgi:hypothetical protein
LGHFSLLNPIVAISYSQPCFWRELTALIAASQAEEEQDQGASGTVRHHGYKQLHGHEL